MPVQSGSNRSNQRGRKIIVNPRWFRKFEHTLTSSSDIRGDETGPWMRVLSRRVKCRCLGLERGWVDSLTGPSQGRPHRVAPTENPNRIYGSQTDPCAGAQARRGQDDFVATSIRVPGVGREIRQFRGLGPPQGDRIGSPLQKTQNRIYGSQGPPQPCPGRPHRVAPTENPNRIYGS